MTTIVTINFTADDGSLGLDDSRFFGPPAELLQGDFKRREPIAWAAANEFVELGTTSGVVTVSAV